MVCIGCCLSSAYYGTARYGLSFYGLVMPILSTMSMGTVGAAALVFSDQGDATLAYSSLGDIAFSYDNY